MTEHTSASAMVKAVGKGYARGNDRCWVDFSPVNLFDLYSNFETDAARQHFNESQAEYASAPRTLDTAVEHATALGVEYGLRALPPVGVTSLCLFETVSDSPVGIVTLPVAAGIIGYNAIRYANLVLSPRPREPLDVSPAALVGRTAQGTLEGLAWGTYGTLSGLVDYRESISGYTAHTHFAQTEENFKEKPATLDQAARYGARSGIEWGMRFAAPPALVVGALYHAANAFASGDDTQGIIASSLAAASIFTNAVVNIWGLNRNQ